MCEYVCAILKYDFHLWEKDWNIKNKTLKRQNNPLRIENLEFKAQCVRILKTVRYNVGSLTTLKPLQKSHNFYMLFLNKFLNDNS